MRFEKLTKILGTTALVLSAFVIVNPAFSAGATARVSDGLVYEDYSHDFGSRAGVSGEVERIIDGRSFVVEGAGLFGSDVLVITAGEELSESTIRDMSQNEVHIEGRAQSLSVSQIEKQTGIDLSASKLQEFTGKTVIVAQTIDVK